MTGTASFPGVLKALQSACCAAAFALAILAAPNAVAVEPSLDAVAADIAARWPKLGHVTPGELEAMMRAGDVALFDVREREEQAVSHIRGATPVSPDMQAVTFLARHGAAVEGKRVVFYCSVGVRSSKLASRVAVGLEQRGATSVSNLRGGIFAWHNERRALESASGATGGVHPYDSNWGRLLNSPAN